MIVLYNDAYAVLCRCCIKLWQTVNRVSDFLDHVVPTVYLFAETGERGVPQHVVCDGARERHGDPAQESHEHH